MKKCKQENCNNLVFSKGLCKYHQPRKNYSKKTDFETDDLDKLSISELKRTADYWLRQFLLHEQKNNTYLWCPIKNKTCHKNKMHVAHFIDRAVMNTRYDLYNCHLISEDSNVWDAQIPSEGFKSKHHKEYEDWLKEKIGEEKLKELLHKSKELCIFAKEDYINVINRFRNECKK